MTLPLAALIMEQQSSSRYSTLNLANACQSKSIRTALLMKALYGKLNAAVGSAGKAGRASC